MYQGSCATKKKNGVPRVFLFRLARSRLKTVRLLWIKHSNRLCSLAYFATPGTSGGHSSNQNQICWAKTQDYIDFCGCMMGPDCCCPPYYYRGGILNRTYGTHKNLYITLFLLTILVVGPIYYWSPVTVCPSGRKYKERLYINMKTSGPSFHAQRGYSWSH